MVSSYHWLVSWGGRSHDLKPSKPATSDWTSEASLDVWFRKNSPRRHEPIQENEQVIGFTTSNTESSHLGSQQPASWIEFQLGDPQVLQEICRLLGPEIKTTWTYLVILTCIEVYRNLKGLYEHVFLMLLKVKGLCKPQINTTFNGHWVFLKLEPNGPMVIFQ